jgi:hypothetical protein
VKAKYPVIFLALLLLGAGVFVQLTQADVKTTHDMQLVTLAIVQHAGDTAQVSKRTPVVAVDSFAYIDTFSYHADTLAHKTITWTSHPQRQRLTPSATWDATRVISCSLVTATGTWGVTIDPDAAYTTAAKICDTLTWGINNKAVFKDSILAVDSTTYVKLVDKNTGVYRTARWTLKIALVGGATSTLDTLTNAQRITAGYITTVAQICDSMVKKINDSPNLDSFLTAYDSTTFYITKSDDPGVLFWDSSKCDADTHATVARSQANVTSRSRIIDTLPLTPMVTTTDGLNWSGFYADFYVGAGHSTTQGVGLSDSVYLRILAGRQEHGVWDYDIVSADSCACPCSLHVAKPAAVANDTLFKDGLFLYVNISDTASDSTFNVFFPIYSDYRFYNLR